MIQSFCVKPGVCDIAIIYLETDNMEPKTKYIVFDYTEGHQIIKENKLNMPNNNK